MNLMPQSLFGNSGISSADFSSFHRAYAASKESTVQYDVNGNHSNKTYNEAPDTEGRGPWRSYSQGSVPSLAETQTAHGTIHYLPTSSMSTSSLLQHRQLAGGATSTLAQPTGWNQNGTSSVLGALHSSQMVPSGDFGVPVVPMLPWTTADGSSTNGQGYNQFGMVPNSGTTSNYASWPPAMQTDNNTTIGAVTTTPSGWPSEGIGEIKIPVPTRVLSSTDIALLQNDPSTIPSKTEPPEEIQPEAFITPIPVVANLANSQSRSRHTSTTSTSSTSSSVSEVRLDMELANPSLRPNRLRGRVSYLEMVARALMSSSDLCLPLAKLYDFVYTTYPHLQTIAVKSWKNSVRHTLSSQPCFLKNQGSVYSLHTWRLHAAFLSDFKKNHFDSGLVKKRAKDLLRMSCTTTQTTSSSTTATQKNMPHTETSQASNANVFKFPDLIPHVESFASVMK